MLHCRPAIHKVPCATPRVTLCAVGTLNMIREIVRCDTTTCSAFTSRFGCLFCFIKKCFAPMVYDARAIANFFLDYGASKGQSITIMSLLKIIFFAHAWHLAKTGEPLVGQPFEAWQYGPVSRVVYEQFKSSKKQPINTRAKALNAAAGRYEVAECRDLDAATIKLLRDIFDYYSRFHPYRLSHLTHEKGSPWDNVWEEATRRAVPGMIISNDSIREWFQNRRSGTQQG